MYRSTGLFRSVPPTDTHCSIPLTRSFSSRSIPFAARILRAVAMIAAASARFVDLLGDTSVASPATESTRSAAMSARTGYADRCDAYDGTEIHFFTWIHN